jgi:MYXO-CTERM domain-containing protein
MNRPLSTLCQSVVHAMDCFDTGQDTHLVFGLESRPFLWIVERVPKLDGESPVFTLWPGECGQPEVFVPGSGIATCDHQYRIHALEGTGLRAMSKPFCPAGLLKIDDPDGGAPPDQPPPGGDDAGAPPVTVDAGPPAPIPGHDGVGTHEVTGSSGCSVGGGSAGGTLLMLLLLLARRRR